MSWSRGDSMDMIVTTTPQVPGYRIKEVEGLVMGLAPRSRGFRG